MQQSLSPPFSLSLSLSWGLSEISAIMEGDRRSAKAVVICFLFVGLVSLTPAATGRSLEALDDQKNYYSSPADPHAGGSTPSHHGHKKPACPTPSSGGSSTPSHGSGGSYTPTPSHGSGGSYGTPTPDPSHGSGGSYGTPTPSHGSGGSGYGTPTPSHGSGGYYNSPPTSGGAPVVIPTPSTPVVVPTPSTPTSPSYDPNVPPYSPGTCTYWSTHPAVIWGIFGYWGTIGDFFGTSCAVVFGKNPSLLDALSNPRTDGIGALYREGTAALLNSMACKTYTFTPEQVRHAFGVAVLSDKTAAAQAELFKHANEGR